MKRVYGVMRIARVLALIGVVSLWANFQSKGLGLNLVETPGGANFDSPSLGVSYSSGTFQAISENGADTLILSYDYNYQDTVWLQGDFTLTATITPQGTLTSGSFTINGEMPGYGLLLSGQLKTGADGVAFGSELADPNNAIFEFPFAVTGGDPTIVSDFGGIGSLQGAVILHATFVTGVGDIPFTGSWTSGFNGLASQDAVSDTAVVPEPSSIMLVLVGCMVFVGAHRAKAAKRGCV